jgi:hypothetical protein
MCICNLYKGQQQNSAHLFVVSFLKFIKGPGCPNELGSWIT